MYRYVLRRLLFVVPTLLAVSLLLFGLSRLAPGDPVRTLYGDESAVSADPARQAELYAYNARQLGMHLPPFYFTLGPGVLPDSLHRICPPERRERLRRLCLQGGAWTAVSEYDRALVAWMREVDHLPDGLAVAAPLRSAGAALWKADRREDLVSAANALGRMTDTLPALHEPWRALVRAAAAVASSPPQNRWAVSFCWHGTDNQYHRWLSGFVRGDLGRSLINRRPVTTELYPALCVTLLINGVSLLLAFALAVWLGAALATRRGRWADAIGQTALLALYAVPTFWLGVLLMLLLATPDAGLHWLPGAAAQPWAPALETFGHWYRHNAARLLLPMLTLALHVLGIFALQMRGGLLRTMTQPFVRTARAKGLAQTRVVWAHGVPNALFPMIALLAQTLPAIFNGSLVLEYLFQVPGMGAKTQEAFLGRDYPVLFAIAMLSAAITVVANLVADILYAWLDPRVRY
ncbi:MAG: ABC transporter permease [Saprospiraceae bacterium]|nr:ABC transporter permease [Saprospiraceae bacterium]